MKKQPPSRLKKILADNIKSYRFNKNLSQEKLADLCGLHRTYIGSVERCERNISLDTLELIANSLNVSVPQLLTKISTKQ